AFEVGASEVEYVPTTQTLLNAKSISLELRMGGRVAPGISAKDVSLYLIGQISTSGGVGYCVEYTGDVIRSLSMENRMTVCNMSIEAGARAGLIAPDEKTFAWVQGRPFAPQGADWEAAIEGWRRLPTDPGATFDALVTLH